MRALDGRHHGIVGQLVRVIHERQLASLMFAALFRMAQLTLRAAARRGGRLRAVATMGNAIVIPAFPAIASIAASAYNETTRSGRLHAALVRQTGLVDGHVMLRTSACRQSARRHNRCHLRTLARRGQQRTAQQGAGGSGGTSSRTTTIARRATICIQCWRSIAAGHCGRGHAHAVRVMILMVWMLELVRQVVVMVAACEVRTWLTGHHAGNGGGHGNHGLSCGSWCLGRSGHCAAWLLWLWLWLWLWLCLWLRLWLLFILIAKRGQRWLRAAGGAAAAAIGSGRGCSRHGAAWLDTLDVVWYVVQSQR